MKCITNLHKHVNSTKLSDVSNVLTRPFSLSIITACYNGMGVIQDYFKFERVSEEIIQKLLKQF